jgi:hypothetical protein
VQNELSEYNRYRRKFRRGLPIVGKNGDSMFLNSIKIDIIKSSDSSYHVHKLIAATGKTSELATDRASRISYPVIQNDTSLIIPKGFMISKADKFRNQQVMIVVEVPVGKKIEIDNSANSFSWFQIGFYGNDWDNDWHGRYHWRPDVEYIMTEGGLETTAVKEEKNSDDNDDAKTRRKGKRVKSDSLTLNL